MTIDDKVLVDGGILNNLPEDVAMEMGADVIISVDVLSKNYLNKKPNNAIEVLLSSVNVMTKEVQKIKAYHSDILIQPDTSTLCQMKFGKNPTMKAIRVGIAEAEKYIDKIKMLIKD